MVRKTLALLAGTILLILAFMFSVVLIAIITVFGLTAWGYLRWKTRKLRRAMQEQAPEAGQVIDGEAIIVEEYRVHTEHVLPVEPPRRDE